MEFGGEVGAAEMAQGVDALVAEYTNLVTARTLRVEGESRIP